MKLCTKHICTMLVQGKQQHSESVGGLDAAGSQLAPLARRMALSVPYLRLRAGTPLLCRFLLSLQLRQHLLLYDAWVDRERVGYFEATTCRLYYGHPDRVSKSRLPQLYQVTAQQLSELRGR